MIDFLLGLARHAIHGTLGAAHGAVNLVGHVLLGDEKTTGKIEIVVFLVVNRLPLISIFSK